VALFAGGINFDTQAYATVDIYNAMGGTWSTGTLPQAGTSMATVSVNDMALFAGAGAGVNLYNVMSGTWSTATLYQHSTITFYFNW